MSDPIESGHGDEQEPIWPWLRLLVGLKVNKVWPWAACIVIYGWAGGRRHWNEARDGV